MINRNGAIPVPAAREGLRLEDANPSPSACENRVSDPACCRIIPPAGPSADMTQTRCAEDRYPHDGIEQNNRPQRSHAILRCVPVSPANITRIARPTKRKRNAKRNSSARLGLCRLHERMERCDEYAPDAASRMKKAEDARSSAVNMERLPDQIFSSSTVKWRRMGVSKEMR